MLTNVESWVNVKLMSKHTSSSTVNKILAKLFNLLVVNTKNAFTMKSQVLVNVVAILTAMKMKTKFAVRI